MGREVTCKGGAGATGNRQRVTMALPLAVTRLDRVIQ
jgi:hypothetical protein